MDGKKHECFNLNLLECKFLYVALSKPFFVVLISTYWNVNNSETEFANFEQEF